MTQDDTRRYYDFAVELKAQYKEIKDKPEGSVPYSLSYIPWILKVTSEVYRKHHKRYDFNELLSVAFLAAVEAEQKYKAGENNFTTYAKYHVEPALNEYVSNMSKTQLALQKRIFNFILGYFKEHSMYPSEGIIRKELKISEETFRHLSLSVSVEQIDDENDNIISNDITAEQSMLVDEYFKAIDYIDVDNQGILRLKIIEDLPFQIICKRLSLTKEKVQKLYDSAIAELRVELEKRGLTKEDLLWEA